MRLWHYADLSTHGCFHYREAVPLLGLVQRGHTVHTSTDLSTCRLADWDAFLFARGYDLAQHPDLPQLLAELRDLAIPILYEVDDAMDLFPPWQVEYLAIQRLLPTYYHFLHTADLVTTTTDWLAAHLRSIGARRVLVLPNTMTPAWKLKRPALPAQLPRVGFVGSVSHIEDVRLWLEALTRLDRATCQPVLMGIGRQPDQDTAAFFRASYQARDRRHRDWGPLIDRLADQIRTLGDWLEWHPTVPIPDYWAACAALRLDIGCVPLVDTPFNRCKSLSKATEYMTRGVCTLASPLVNTGDPVVCVDPNTPAGWAEYLAWYIAHPTERLQIAQDQQRWTIENREPAFWASIRERSYRLVVADPLLTTSPASASGGASIPVPTPAEVSA